MPQAIHHGLQGCLAWHQYVITAWYRKTDVEGNLNNPRAAKKRRAKNTKMVVIFFVQVGIQFILLCLNYWQQTIFFYNWEKGILMSDLQTAHRYTYKRCHRTWGFLKEWNLLRLSHSILSVGLSPSHCSGNSHQRFTKTDSWTPGTKVAPLQHLCVIS